MASANIPTLAWRNIWRNRRRTLITLVSIAFGLFLAVLMTGLGDSTYSKMIDHAARLGGGHIVVQHEGYLDMPSLDKTVQATPELVAELRAREDVRAASPRIVGGMMVQTSTNNVGAMVIAFDPSNEDETTLGLVESLAAGSMFESAHDEGIILGKTLAENLDAELGDKVVYTATDKNNDIASGLARVSGIIETGATEVDAGIALLPLEPVRALLGYEANEVTQIALFLDDHRQSEVVAARLGPELESKGDASAAALPWFEANADLAGYVSMEVTGTLVFELIITVLIAAGIFNTLFVSVMERLRELGILAAIGFSAWQLFALVIWESIWLALCGIAAGVTLTAWPYYHLNTKGFDFSVMMGGTETAQVSGVSMSTTMYVDIYPNHALFIGVAVILATVAAGLYPAIKAGRVSPVETIRVV